MNSNDEYTRPRIADIWQVRSFSHEELAQLAKVDIEDILHMFSMYPVSQETAESVLTALSAVLEKDFSLETVRVAIFRKTVPFKERLMDRNES